MKKVFIYTLAITAMMVACQPKDGQQNADVQKTTLQEVLDTTELETRVRDIYAAVFHVYNLEDSLRNAEEPVVDGVLDESNDFNGQYCSHEWNKLVKSINENDVLRHEGEQGFWEADYWIMGQDWGELSVSDIKVFLLKGDSAAVEFQLHNLGNMINVVLDMVHEDGEWKIDNFTDITNGMDWKATMKRYLEDEQANR